MLSSLIFTSFLIVIYTKISPYHLLFFPLHISVHGHILFQILILIIALLDSVILLAFRIYSTMFVMKWF